MTTYDDITIPDHAMPYKLTNINGRTGLDFEGLPSFNHVFEISPRQAGVRSVGVAYQERYGSLTLNIPKWMKHEMLHMFSPSRPFESGETFVYNRYHEGGKLIRGNDGEITTGFRLFRAKSGNFLDGGGLRANSYITVDGVKYQIKQALSDSVLELYDPFVTTSNNVRWEYVSGVTCRKLAFLVNGGFQFIRTDVRNTYTIETIEIVAPDPFWYGEIQYVTWFNFGTVANKKYPVEYPKGNIFDQLQTLESVIVYPTSDLFVRPEILLQGRLTYFKITNVEEDTFISYVNFIPEGEFVSIKLEEATATHYTSRSDLENDVNGTNVLKYVLGDRSTFGIRPHSDNTIEVDTDSQSAAESFASVFWRNKYLGS